MNTNNNDYDINLDNYPVVDNEEDVDDLFSGTGIDDIDNVFDSKVEKPDDFFEKSENNDIVDYLLSQKGIVDSTKIQFQTEDGTLEEVDFKTLSREEQIAILEDKLETPEIHDNEIEVINFMRENNLTFEQILESERQRAVNDYINSNQDVTYTVDDLSDEDLYKLDLQSRYPSLTDDEVDNRLTKELEQPDIFKKLIDSTREEYKGLEQEQLDELTSQKVKEEEETYTTLVNTMVDIAENTTDLYSLDLEDNDKEEVLTFLLDRDINGQSEFAKILNNPEQLFKLAWFALKGDEAFNVTHEYYKREIDSARKQVSIQPTRTVIKTPKATTEDTYGIWEK